MKTMNSTTESPLLNQTDKDHAGFRQTFLKFCVLLAAALVADAGHAEDSLAALMQRMKSDTAVRIAYQETRTLELVDQPWQGSGYMYSLPPDIMIKEQLQPERILMGVTGEKMFYYDIKNDVRRQGEMNEDNALTLNIAVFKALINADEALLHNLYQVDFSAQSERWEMTLKPKQDSQTGFVIDISGRAQQQADTIKVRQRDGDSSEFLLQKDAEGEDVKATASRLYLELLGE